MRVLLFLLALFVMTPPAAAAWKVAITPHFVIYSENSDRVLLEYATKVERFDNLLRLRYGISSDETAPKLTIYALPDAASVQKLLSGGRKNRSVAGFYVPDASGSYALISKDFSRSDEEIYDSAIYDGGDVIFFHEYTHHFMHRYFPAAYPGWFTEGFAEYLGTVTFTKTGNARIGLPARHRAVGLTLGPRITAETLFTRMPHELGLEAGDAYYGRAWLLVHFLYGVEARKDQLRTYLMGITQGKSSLEAAKSAFGDLKQLDKELDKYALGVLRYATQKYPTPVTDSIRVETLSDAQSNLVTMQIQFKIGIEKENKAAYVKDLQRHLEKYPDSADAWHMLADTYFRFGEDQAAAKALDSALTANPNHGRALLLKAEMRMEALRKAPSATDEEWKAMRTLIGAANRADVNDPMPLLLYHRSWVVRGMTPSETAHKGLKRAYELASEDRSVAMAYALSLEQRGSYDQAIRIAEMLSFDPHGREFGDAARKMLARLKEAKARKAEPASAPNAGAGKR